MAATPANASPALPVAGDITETVAKVADLFPCRENEILELAMVLSSKAAASPVFLQGPPSSGKSAISRQVLHELHVPHAYVSCIEHHRPRKVLQRILHQVHGGKRTRDGLYNAPISCANYADFMTALRPLINKFNRSFWIVLDDAQKLAGSDILLSLARLPEQGFHIGLLLISRYPWSMGAFLTPTASIQTPIIIEMSQYGPSQLQKVAWIHGLLFFYLNNLILTITSSLTMKIQMFSKCRYFYTENHQVLCRTPMRDCTNNWCKRCYQPSPGHPATCWTFKWH